MKDLTVVQCEYEECRADKRAVSSKCSVNMLHIVVSGRGFMNGTLVHAGQAFLCRDGVVSRWRPDPTDPWTYYWINTHGTLADKILENCFGNATVLDFPITEDAVSLLRMIRGNPVQDFRAGIFIALTGLMKPTVFQSGLPVPEQHVLRAEEIIRSTDGKITPSELAKQLNLSGAYLYNVFMKRRGCSVQSAILNYRMTRAEELLIETDCTIAMVASIVGYEDQFSFSKSFRAKHNRSPSRFRTDQREYYSMMNRKKPEQPDNTVKKEKT